MTDLIALAERRLLGEKSFSAIPHLMRPGIGVLIGLNVGGVREHQVADKPLGMGKLAAGFRQFIHRGLLSSGCHAFSGLLNCAAKHFSALRTRAAMEDKSPKEVPND
jgi:hypothetical protein